MRPIESTHSGSFSARSAPISSAVAPAAADAEAELVVGRHVLAGAEPQGADLQRRLHVLAHDSPHVVSGEGILCEHERRSARVALLAGLEEPEDRALEVAAALQAQQHAVEHGGMHVVAAGVHDARMLRPPRHVGPLVDGQRVDVGAQHHGTPQVAAALDRGQHARGGGAAVGDAGARQLFADERGGGLLAERELRIAVQVAAERHGVEGCCGCFHQKTDCAMRRMLSVRPIV